MTTEAQNVKAEGIKMCLKPHGRKQSGQDNREFRHD
jgi:hypothetical protein